MFSSRLDQIYNSTAVIVTKGLCIKKYLKKKMVEFSFKYSFADRKILQAHTQPVRMFQPITTWSTSSLHLPHK